MRHFLKIKVREEEIRNSEGNKETVVSVYPSYSARSNDLMRKGNQFYAVYDPFEKMWTTSEEKLVDIIDDELYLKRDELGEKDRNGVYRTASGKRVVVKSLDDSDTKRLKDFKQWMMNLSPNHSFVPLDSEITRIDEEVKPEDYRSKRLKYKIEEGSIESYDLLMKTLYSEENRRKLEWAIGSVFVGDSKDIDKFVVLYGDPGTGKSTILDLIKKLFDGYWTVFIASELVSKSSQFGTAAFKDNPLVAIQDDGSLAKIESPVLNEFISHKETTINEKGKRQYIIRPNAFMFMATNELVDIHDTKLGITRRLLDVYPTGNKLPVKEYRKVKKHLDFELGAIANHCIEVYKECGKDYYEGYVPEEMIKKTNYLKNFMFDNLERLEDNDPITRNLAYEWYANYFEESGLGYPPKRIIFTEQLKEYYKEYKEIAWVDGRTVRHLYSGLNKDKILGIVIASEEEKEDDWLDLKEMKRDIMEKQFHDCPAQYANDEDKPVSPWDKVTTKLCDLDPTKTHYVRLPLNVVTIDFDKKDQNGNKSFELNKAAALKWPRTYAELSKGGEGIHLEYFYTGDASKLSHVVEEDVEIKVCTGKSSLRRRLSKCNNLPIATISGGLPLKGGKDMMNFDAVKSEKALRTIIKDCLDKKHHGATKPEVDFIFKVLGDAYDSGLKYDVRDLRPAVLAFANNSSNQALTCIKIVNKMHFFSDDMGDSKEAPREKSIIFYDVEVFPNLFIVCWKKRGAGNEVTKMINPSASDIEALVDSYRLVGFNNRRYDNHILYARMMGYTEFQLYNLSQRIISGSKNAMFGQAYNLSYTDIYDFCSKKQSLKKWEIELGIHHQENAFPWDMPVPEENWFEIADYCANDVRATEAVFEARQQDFIAREILSDISGLTVNDTTNQQTAKIIFGDDKNPQSEFVYTDLSEMFPGYTFESGHSTYRGEDPGEGGYVYSEPGMYGNVALLDIASMHPTSIEQLNLFGPYTKNFSMLKQARIYIKHHDYASAGKMFDGKLKPYLTSDEQAGALSYALKIVINSVYGLTSAKFDNKFRDPRNIDNIVAKRGALFMINLKHEVQKKGFVVAHIKTDSIKIPDATPEIIQFVMDYGKKYGYIFEHEATYEKMCLVNDAVYVAKYKDGPHWDEDYKKELWWTATGAQFKVPYIFKTLFIKEPLEFKDMCETRTVSTALYLDMNEGLPEDEHKYRFVGKAGQFCPIKPGCGGGILLREKDGKYNSAPNSKGYRWLESEVVKNLHKEADIDFGFYKEMVDSAVHDISEWGDFEWFASDDPYTGKIEIPIDSTKAIDAQIKELKEEDEPLPF